MDFEDIGGFGSYQKILVIVFLIPSFIVIPWFSMNLIFMTNTPEHWCYVPEVASSNLSLKMQKELIRPLHDLPCLMYDVNYSQILSYGNLTVDPSWPTKECTEGWQYDTTEYDATAVTRWDMVCKDDHFSSLVFSLFFIGYVLGTPFYGFLSDKIGRKPVFLFLAIVTAVSEIGSVLSPNFTLFLLLRTINGSAKSIYGVGYIIFLEIVNPEIRTRLNGLTTISWTIGMCLLPMVAYLTRDWVRLSIITSFAASMVLYWELLPESPSWLISEKRYVEAHKIMTKISKVNGKTAHEGSQLMKKIEELGEKIQTQKREMGKEKHSPLEFLKYPTLRKRFFLVTICRMGVSIPYYGLHMNGKNLVGSEFVNFFLMSLVEIPSHFATWVFLERIGRRWCSVLAFTFTTIACLMPVIFLPEYKRVGVIASLFAKVGTSSAYMTLYQQCPELFPTSLRALGMGLSGTIGTGSTLLVPYIVYLAKYGTYIPFMIFFTITFLSGICASFLPETLNKKLPQIVADAENFEKGFKFFSC